MKDKHVGEYGHISYIGTGLFYLYQNNSLYTSLWIDDGNLHCSYVTQTSKQRNCQSLEEITYCFCSVELIPWKAAVMASFSASIWFWSIDKIRHFYGYMIVSLTSAQGSSVIFQRSQNQVYSKGLNYKMTLKNSLRLGRLYLSWCMWMVSWNIINFLFVSLFFVCILCLRQCFSVWP